MGLAPVYRQAGTGPAKQTPDREQGNMIRVTECDECREVVACYDFGRALYLCASCCDAEREGGGILGPKAGTIERNSRSATRIGQLKTADSAGDVAAFDGWRGGRMTRRGEQ